MIEIIENKNYTDKGKSNMPKVSFTDQDKSYELLVGDILFDGLEAQNETLPHGCLSGSCGACRVLVTKGMELLEKPIAIELNTIEAIKKEKNLQGDIRLSCRAKIIADGEIEIQAI